MSNPDEFCGKACIAAPAHTLPAEGGDGMNSVVRGVILRGVPVSVCGMLGAGLLLTAAELPLPAYGICAALSLTAGCFFAGMEAGRRRRRNGLFCGLSAALLLTGLWYAAAWLLLHSAGLPAVLLAAVPCGMCGGVIGTGRRAPALHRRLHGAAGARERLRLRFRLLHLLYRPKKPKKKPSAQSRGKSEY